LGFRHMLDSLLMMLEASPVHRTQPVKEIYCGKWLFAQITHVVGSKWN